MEFLSKLNTRSRLTGEINYPTSWTCVAIFPNRACHDDRIDLLLQHTLLQWRIVWKECWLVSCSCSCFIGFILFSCLGGGGIKQRGRKVNAHIRFETCITVLPQFEIWNFEIDWFWDCRFQNRYNETPHTHQTTNPKPKALAQINCYWLLSIDLLHSDKDINNVSSNRG